MTSGKKWAIVALLVGILAIGGEILYLHHERNAAWAPATPSAQGTVDPDALVFLKQERP